MFHLKDAKRTVTAIEAIASIYGKKYKYATGFSVNPENWKGERAKYTRTHPEGKTINEQLAKIETAVADATEYFRLRQRHPQNNEFRVKVDEYLQNKTHNQIQPLAFYMESFIAAKNAKPNTKKKYYTAINKLKAYQTDKKTLILPDDIDIGFYNTFREWFYNQQREQKKVQSSGFKVQSEESIPLPYSKNYFGSIVKCIKRVMNHTLENNVHQNIKFRHSEFVVDKEPAQTIYLTVDELMLIFNLVITPELVLTITDDKRPQNINAKTESLKRIRDRFLIGAFTALRVSDFNRLTDYNIDNNFLRIVTRKTQTPVIIPLHPVVKTIIARGGLDYKISVQKINEHIKEVCQLAGITQLVTTTRSHGNRAIDTTAPKYKLVQTHTARRSACTNMFKNGIPAIAIMKLSGHTTERSFLKYIKISEEENAELLANHTFFK